MPEALCGESNYNSNAELIFRIVVTLKKEVNRQTTKGAQKGQTAQGVVPKG